MGTFSTLLLQKTEILEIVKMSIMVSGSATIISAFIGIPLGAWMGLTDFKGRKVLLRIVYTLMALPPVLAGLLVYLLLSRSGPLGVWESLFTPTAMIIAQCLLVTPIITGLVAAAIAGKEGIIFDHALSLGASQMQATWTIIKETRSSMTAAVLTGFGRAFAEVGAVMLVGGNIRHMTRVLTTSIVLETRQGNFNIAVTLGIILLIISFVVSSIVLSNADEFKMT
ncbi:MAG: ABC transporter permease [Syntrophomonadaceae bacterium]|nr:ABC transporter permease [Syntrophomonadaceae bacterium]MDD3022275.1 ABC transporter permease [Syntrophomonadaceae bacterium]